MHFTPETIDAGITSTSFGLENFYQQHYDSYRAWSRNEPVPSLFQSVSQWNINQALVDRALKEIAQQGIVYHIDQTDPPIEINNDLPPFLATFLNVCARRFESIVLQDLPANVDPLNVLEETHVHCGPYQLVSGDTWHRDSGDPDEVTYLLTIAGPPTEFARGSYRSSDFDRINDDFLGDPQINIDAIQTYPTGTMTVHDGGFALHQAPPETCTGQPRINLRLRLFNFFDNSQTL